MPTSPSDSAIVLELAEEFLDRHRRGERPTLREYLDRHPELAAAIREVFPAVALMENVALADDSLAAPPAPEPPPPTPGPQQLGDYRIIREVGRGGMGVVYEAEQVSLGRHVALKVLPHKAHSDARHKRRFEREARAAAKLHHTNIVPVFGVGEHDGLPYYVMQFIHGLGLNKVLDELRRLKDASPPSPPSEAAAVAQSLLTGGFARSATIDHPPDGSGTPTPPLSGSSAVLSLHSGSEKTARPPSYWQSVARVGVQVASALEHAHQQGILHRDVKPSNLLLDTRGVVWVTDFGLAKADDQDNLTATGDVLGTLRYMPPEAFEGKADRRSDVYALGMTLYELLALRPAFGERDRVKLIKEVTTTEPARLDTVNRAIPRDLVTVVEKACHREPSRRYPTAAELQADLERFLADEPIRARPITAIERFGRWCRRNPVVAGLVAAVVVVTAVGFATTLVQMRAALDNEDRANKNAAVIEDQRDDARRTADTLKKTQEELRATLYGAHVNLMQIASDADKTAPVVELLDLYKPRPGQTDPRGWEWHYLNRRHRGYLSNVDLGQPLSMSATLSPDGTRVADVINLRPAKKGEAERGDIALVWDAATGKLLVSAPLGVSRLQSGGSHSHLLSFSKDGTRLAVLLSEMQSFSKGPRFDKPALCRLAVLDVATGKRLLFLEMDSTAHHPNAVAFSADGSHVAAQLSPKEMKVWSVAGDRPPLTLPLPGAGMVSPHFNADGTRLLTVAGIINRKTEQQEVWVTAWDATTGAEVHKFQLPADTLPHVVIDPTGKHLAALRVVQAGPGWPAGTSDQTLVICEVATGKEITSFAPSQLFGLAVVFSPRGDRLAGAQRHGAPSVWIWDVASGVKRRTLRGHVSSVVAVSFSGDGKRVVAAAKDGTIKTWDAEGDDDPFRAESENDSPTTMVANEDGTRFAANTFRDAWPGKANPVEADQPTVIRVLDGAGKELTAFKKHTTPLMHMAFSPGGAHMVSVASFNREDEGNDLRVWDAATGEQRWQFRYPLLRKGVGRQFTNAFSFRPDGKRLALVIPLAVGKDARCQVQVRDVETGQQIGAAVELPGMAAQVKYSADGRRLIGWSFSNRLKTWDAETGKEIWSYQTSEHLISAVASSRDGARLAVLSSLRDKDRTAVPLSQVTLLDGERGVVLRTFSLGKSAAVVAFEISPDGRWVAVALRTGTYQSLQQGTTVKVFDADSGAERFSLRGHVGLATSIAFTPDSRRLATASSGQPGEGNQPGTEVKLWELATGHDLLTLRPASDFGELRFSPDGHRLVLIGDSRHGRGGRTQSGNHATIWDATPLPE